MPWLFKAYAFEMADTTTKMTMLALSRASVIRRVVVTTSSTHRYSRPSRFKVGNWTRSTLEFWSSEFVTSCA